jgi:hypothetical protein
MLSSRSIPRCALTSYPRATSSGWNARPAQEGEELYSTQRKFLPAVIGYVIAILIGLALPVAAVALYSGLAVYLVVPFREAARVLIRRHGTRK